MYSATDISIVTFQREFVSPFKLTDVMYVPGLTMNLVSIIVLEDRGYNVIFRKGKVFLKDITTGQVKQIGVQFKNLYALEVQYTCNSLRGKEKVRDSVVEKEHKLPLNLQPQQVVEQP